MSRLQIILWVASFRSTSRGENTGANDKENYFPTLGISENNCQGQCWEAERTRGRSLFFISDNLVLIFPTVDMKWWPCSLSSVPHFTNEISFLVKKCRNYPSARGCVRNVETRRREELLSSSDVGSERGRVVSCLLADSELEVSCWPVFRLLTPTQHHVSPRELRASLTKLTAHCVLCINSFLWNDVTSVMKSETVRNCCLSSRVRGPQDIDGECYW